jgi:hypothetical protein
MAGPSVGPALSAVVGSPTGGPQTTPSPPSATAEPRDHHPASRGSDPSIGPNQLFDPTLIAGFVGAGGGAAGAASSGAGPGPPVAPAHDLLADLTQTPPESATAFPAQPVGPAQPAAEVSPPQNAPVAPATGPTGQPIGDLKWDSMKNQWFDPSTNAHFTQFGPTWYNPDTNQTYRIGDLQIIDPSSAPVPEPPPPTAPSLWPLGGQWLATTILGEGSVPPGPAEDGADAWADGFKQALVHADWDGAVASTQSQSGDAVAVATGQSPVDLPSACQKLVANMGTAEILAVVGRAWGGSAIDQFANTLITGGPVAPALAQFPSAIVDALPGGVDYYQAHPQQLQEDAATIAGNLLFHAVATSAAGAVGGAVTEGNGATPAAL